MKLIHYIMLICFVSCKHAQMSTKKSDSDIIIDHKISQIKIITKKRLNKKHPSYKYYDNTSVPTDNSIKNKKDVKKANQSKKYKKNQQIYLDELNENKTPDKKKRNDGKFKFYVN